MATSHKKTKARGQRGKSKKANKIDTNDDSSLDDLMISEDKELLKDIVEDGDESDLEIPVTGDDIVLSEISSFLQNLGVDKYRPFPASTSTDLTFLDSYKKRKHSLLKPGEMWREEKLHPIPLEAPDEKVVTGAEKLAQRLLEDEIALYSKQRESTKRSEAHWLKTVLSSGTLSDKMAALTLLVQESPLHNIASLDSLISMAGKKGRRESMMAVDTLRDLFLTGLLPDDRKLRAFNQQPLGDLFKMTSGNIDARDKYLIMWHYENQLKKRYADFIKALGELSFDTLLTTKEKAISTVHHLLTSKPEQENTLLPMLVNKLGDPMIKSKATYLLTKLVDEHPNMNAVIVREVQQVLHRPNISQRAQYYAICFLTQLHLGQAQSDLASQLIQIYFYFFQTFLKKGEIDNKMMSALLTGVNRAYVFAKSNKEQIARQMDTLYKIIPSVNFHTGVQALMLLYQVLDTSTNASDRFYMCLYRKLTDSALRNSSKQGIFLNLLFKSMKSDVVDRRIKAFVKRVLQIYSQHPPHTLCGVMILLSQIIQNKPGILKVKNMTPGVWSDDEEEKFVDLPAPEEFDTPLSNGALNDDENGEDTSRSHETGSRRSQESEKSNDTYQDSKDSDLVKKSKPSWVHRKNFGGTGHTSEYDPLNRNPLYAKAELDSLWELKQLTNHYHPTVQLYARSLLQGKTVEYDGDPLKDFTLIRFLDRFVYKNPKKDLEQKTAAMRQFKKSGLKGIRAIPVNSKEYLELGEDSVPEDEKFFYQYFNERAKKRQDDLSDVDSDAGSIKDEEFDAFLDGFEKDADDDYIGDMDLDFAGDKAKSKPQNWKKGGKESEDEDSDNLESEEDDDIDLGDDSLAAEFEQEMEALASEDEALAIDDSDYEEVEEAEQSEEDAVPPPDETDELRMMMLGAAGKKSKKRKWEDDDFMATMDTGSKKKKQKHDTAALFASAEEFAHLLEEETTETGQVSLGGSSDFSNKDKAGEKQMKWERDRDHWLQDRNHYSGGSGKHKKGGKSQKSFRKKPKHKSLGGKSAGKSFKFKHGQGKLKNKRK